MTEQVIIPLTEKEIMRVINCHKTQNIIQPSYVIGAQSNGANQRWDQIGNAELGSRSLDFPSNSCRATDLSARWASVHEIVAIRMSMEDYSRDDKKVVFGELFFFFILQVIYCICFIYFCVNMHIHLQAYLNSPLPLSPSELSLQLMMATAS